MLQLCQTKLRVPIAPINVTICALLLLGLILSSATVFGQSTYGAIIGTVKDRSGALVPGATVKITNTDENTTREVKTNGTGDYELLNVQPAHYTVSVTQNGFQTFAATDLVLVSRQTLRVDAALQVGQMSQAVTVESSEAGVIATDSQVIQETFNPQELLNLPANIRANGNTSPYQLIQVLPGVQADDSGNFSIQGGIQSQTQYSLDGISITNVTGNQPLTNAFPSSESIAEIKVQGVGSPAEYGQVGDVTTISRSGTNQFHGAFFWYTQNAAMNALNFGEVTKPKLVANDFGATIGGPVIIPHLYNGKNRTFFYGTYEGFRYPEASVVQNEVPTQAMRNGNFSAEGVTITDPLTGAPFPNDTIPNSQINPAAVKILSLFPLPNAGNLTTSHAANYIANQNTSYSSDQYDIRIDQYLTSKQSIFGRWTWKDIDALSPNELLVPANSKPDNYRLLVLAYNYAIRPNLLNEARFGFTRNGSGTTNSFNGAAFSQTLGLEGLIGLPAFFNGLPEIDFGSSNFTALNADRLEGISKSRTTQFVDNLTWILGKHTLRFGFDYRHIQAIDPLSFIGGDNYGQFNFTGQFSGSPFADFLLGLPGQTGFDNVQMDNDGITNHYNAYVQDTFRATPKLTLEFGLRFEFHPGYTDASGNIGNFDPSYAKSGAVIYPDGGASLLATGFLASANACMPYGSTTGPSLNGAPCMPVLSASQAGLPNSLRTAPLRFLPHFGFAYRPFDNKTVFRGGFSVYNTEVLGSIYYALTGTLQSATYQYNNSITNGVPAIQWPDVKTGGSGITVPPAGTDYFGTANQINYKDPYSMQWNFSIDRDLGFNTGFRISYIGMDTRDLVWAPDLNQSYYSTTYYVDQPLSSRPFPNWGVVNTRANGADANYNSLQIEVHHRYKSGLTFNSTYTFAKNLADNAGYSATSFAGEAAGGRTMDADDLKHEYGQVYGTRRNRWITTALYELPVGRGRQFGSSMNRFVDGAAGGWQLSSIFLWQSGPFLTPYFEGGDPSGTGSGVIGRAQAPDIVGNPNLSNPTAADWFNAAAYTCPGTPGWKVGTPCLIGNPGYGEPIARFGDAGMSTVVGPGTVNLNAGISKVFSVNEHVRIKVEGSFTNALNHLNLANPVLGIDSSSVGEITSARPSDFGGARTGQAGARIEF
jgi:Carboxypeptidase regulatory-like domain/TonB-dependent Receptor Plug Domain